MATAAAVADHPAAAEDPAHATVGPDDAVFDLVAGAAGQHGLDGVDFGLRAAVALRRLAEALDAARRYFDVTGRRVSRSMSPANCASASERASEIFLSAGLKSAVFSPW